MPVTSSETGCSTWRRVLTSRKEIVPSLADQELAGAGADVAGLLEDGLGGRRRACDLVVGQERCGRLLDQLLVAALQRAVAGGDDHDVAVLVGQALGLDVARLVEVPLHEALAATEGRDRLADRGVVGSGISSSVRATFRPRPPPPKAALIATGRPCSSANATTSSASLTGSVVPGASGAPALCAMCRALTLSPRFVDGLRRRADPDQAGVDHGLGEVGVLGEEAVAGVHGVGAGLRRRPSRIFSMSR